jgi:hypothetical protein
MARKVFSKRLVIGTCGRCPPKRTELVHRVIDADDRGERFAATAEALRPTMRAPASNRASLSGAKPQALLLSLLH